MNVSFEGRSSSARIGSDVKSTLISTYNVILKLKKKVIYKKVQDAWSGVSGKSP